MYQFFAKTGLAVLAAVLVVSPSIAFAESPVTRDHHRFAVEHPVKNLLEYSGSWTTRGTVTRGTDGSITLTEKGSESEGAYKDVDVRGHGGDYVLFAAYTKTEHVRANDITGLPYLYAYAMDANDHILAYFQGERMRREHAQSDVWGVNSGIFRLPKSTVTVRFFLEQAEKSGSTKRGDDATFLKPFVAVARDKDRLSTVVHNYRSWLSHLE